MGDKTSPDIKRILENKGAFISINPGCLDDPKMWSYRGLQNLCKSLEINAKGSREELVNRLNSWHRDKSRADRVEIYDEVNNVEESWIVPTAGQFSLLGVKVKESHEKLLSPFTKTQRKRRDGTPKSIVREARDRTSPIRNKRLDSLRLPLSPKRHTDQNMSPKCDSYGTPPRKSTPNKKSITFSPYNMVKVVPNRRNKQ